LHGSQAPASSWQSKLDASSEAENSKLAGASAASWVGADAIDVSGGTLSNPQYSSITCWTVFTTTVPLAARPASQSRNALKTGSGVE
jgi:hypothetical protein